MSDESPVIPDVSATEQTVPSGDMQSALATVRELRTTLGAGAKPIDIPVPGYQGILVLRNKWIPLRTLSANAKSFVDADETVDARVAAAADLLTLTCDEVLIRVGDELRPLSLTDVPINFSDPRLLEQIGAPPVTTARAAVEAVFKNEYALIRAANTVLAWLQDTSIQVDRDTLEN